MNEHEAGDPAWEDDDDELDALLLAAKVKGMDALISALNMGGAASRHNHPGDRQSSVPRSAQPAEGTCRSRASRSPPDAME
jgi:hypothetical protein